MLVPLGAQATAAPLPASPVLPWFSTTVSPWDVTWVLLCSRNTCGCTRCLPASCTLRSSRAPPERPPPCWAAWRGPQATTPRRSNTPTHTRLRGSRLLRSHFTTQVTPSPRAPTRRVGLILGLGVGAGLEPVPSAQVGSPRPAVS